MYTYATGSPAGTSTFPRMAPSEVSLAALRREEPLAATSARGTKTSDTYALAGFNDALAKAHDVCKM